VYSVSTQTSILISLTAAPTTGNATPPSSHFGALALTFDMDSTVQYLLSLGAIRDRAKIVGQAAKDGNLNHFDVHEDKLDDVADFVTSVIKVR
jgi:septal ring-binding cell division protein DamX